MSLLGVTRQSLSTTKVLLDTWANRLRGMVILDKCHNEDEPSSDGGHTDAPPSYETITADHNRRSNYEPSHIIDEKQPRQSIPTSSRDSNIPSVSHAGCPVSSARSSSSPTHGSSSSWLSMMSFNSSRTSKDVRQTILTLVRDLVLNVESPDLLGSCADACRTYGIDLSILLQKQSIERHSAIYWAILNRRDALLPSFLMHAAPLSQETLSEIRVACLATSNQLLFQALRCQSKPFVKKTMPSQEGTDAILLGSMPPDEVSIHEVEREGAFEADISMNLWQKRMRVTGKVGVDFIARGRIWSLTFFSPSSTTNTTTAGVWQVALCLLEPSPPTYVNSRLIFNLPLPSSNLLTSHTSTSEATDLITLTPPPDDPSSPAPQSFSSALLSDRSKSKSKAPQTFEVRLKSSNRLTCRSSDTFLRAVIAECSGQKRWERGSESWREEDGHRYTNVIVVPFADGPGAELTYDNTPFISADGALYVRLEARLGKPDGADCVVC